MVAILTRRPMVAASDPAMLAHSQTLEDVEANRWPRISLHHEYTSFEFVRYEVCVRRPFACADFDPKLVIRLSQVSTRVTCSLEVLRTE